MRRLLFLTVALVVSSTASVFAQSVGSEQITGSPEGTVLSKWLASTNVAWEESGWDFTLKSNTPVVWAGPVTIRKIQTSYFQEQYISVPAKQRWEVISTYVISEPPVGCVVTQTEPCTPVPVVKNIEGWRSYEQQTAIRNSDSTVRSELDARTIQLAVKIDGQILRSFEHDVIQVRTDENGNGKVYVNAAENKYKYTATTVDSRTVVFVITGQGRDLENSLPSISQGEAGSLFTRTPKVYQDSQSMNRVFAKLGFNPNVIGGAEDPNARIKITYVPHQTGGDHSSDSNYRQLTSGTIVVDPAKIQDVEVNLPGIGRRRHVRADLYINIIGSKFYSEKTIELKSDTSGWSSGYSREDLRMTTK